MRLSLRIQQKLKKVISQSFGDVPVYLFGSRADDSATGGDIDLAVEVNLDSEAFRKKKVAFKVALIQMQFDQLEVDVIPYHTTDVLLAREIDKNAIRLC